MLLRSADLILDDPVYRGPDSGIVAHVPDTYPRGRSPGLGLPLGQILDPPVLGDSAGSIPLGDEIGAPYVAVGSRRPSH